MTDTPPPLQQIGAELAGHAREIRTVAEHVAVAADAIARDMHGLARAACETWEGSPAELSALAQHATADAEEISGLADWLGTCAEKLLTLADTLGAAAKPGPAMAADAVPPAVPWLGDGCPATPKEVAPCGNRA